MIKKLWSPGLEISDENVWDLIFPCLIYNRCSTRNRNQKDYLKVRTRACRDWCVKTDQQIIHTVEDCAKTGKNIDRFGIQQVRKIARIKAGSIGYFKLMVMPEGSRMSRDALDTVYLLRELWKEEDKIFFSLDDGRFYFKKEHISELVRDSLAYEKELDRTLKKLRKGRREKEKLLGKKFAKPKIKLPVKKIVKQYLAGKSMYRLGQDYKVSWETIKDRLVEQGIKIRPNPKMITYIKRIKGEQ